MLGPTKCTTSTFTCNSLNIRLCISIIWNCSSHLCDLILIQLNHSVVISKLIGADSQIDAIFGLIHRLLITGNMWHLIIIDRLFFFMCVCVFVYFLLNTFCFQSRKLKNISEQALSILRKLFILYQHP